MARNDFLPIATGSNAFVLSQEAYAAHPHRVAGQQAGVASAELNNKALRQGASMASAIGQFIAAAGYDARDDGNILTLQKHFAAAVAALISPSIASAVAAAKKKVLEMVFPVGSFYMSVSSATSPATLLGFGQWTPVSGRFLFASNSTHSAGQSGGEEAHTLTVNEMPKHNHAVTVSRAGAHTHTGTVSSAGSHQHAISVSTSGAHFHGAIGHNVDDSFWGLYDAARNHVGLDGYDRDNPIWRTSTDGAHSHSVTMKAAGSHTHQISINSAGAHSHSVVSADVGGNAAHNNMPPYLSVYMWRRTA